MALKLGGRFESTAGRSVFRCIAVRKASFTRTICSTAFNPVRRTLLQQVWDHLFQQANIFSSLLVLIVIIRSVGVSAQLHQICEERFKLLEISVFVLISEKLVELPRYKSSVQDVSIAHHTAQQTATHSQLRTISVARMRSSETFESRSNRIAAIILLSYSVKAVTSEWHDSIIADMALMPIMTRLQQACRHISRDLDGYGGHKGAECIMLTLTCSRDNGV